MRGKENWRWLIFNTGGITPAYAGKSRCAYKRARSARDHPRVCGEKAYSLVINGSEWGSPPRMRGKEEDERAKG